MARENFIDRFTAFAAERFKLKFNKRFITRIAAMVADDFIHIDFAHTNDKGGGIDVLKT